MMRYRRQGRGHGFRRGNYGEPSKGLSSSALMHADSGGLWNQGAGELESDKVIVQYTPPKPGPESECVRLVQEGLLQAFNGRYDASVMNLVRATEKNPLSNPAFFYLGVVLNSQRKKKAATAALEEALKLDRNDIYAEIMLEWVRDGKVRDRTGMYENPDHIKAFLQAREAPLFANMYAISTRAIFNQIKDKQKVRVLDIGLGDGSQMAHLLGLLRGPDSSVIDIEIIGLDPNKEMLDLARKKIEAAGRLSGKLNVTFKSLDRTMGELGDEELRALGDIDVVNSSIAFHHMDADEKARQLVRIKEIMNPGLLVISEDDSHHDIELPRGDVRLIYNIRTEHGTNYDLLRRQLGKEIAKRVNEAFFARDVESIFTRTARERGEWHRSMHNWIKILREAGFDIIPPDEELIEGLDGAAISENGLYTVGFRSKQGKDQFCTMQAKPRPAA